jgi:hypothetical protein
MMWGDVPGARTGRYHEHEEENGDRPHVTLTSRLRFRFQSDGRRAGGPASNVSSIADARLILSLVLMPGLWPELSFWLEPSA